MLERGIFIEHEAGRSGLCSDIQTPSYQQGKGGQRFTPPVKEGAFQGQTHPHEIFIFQP
jgi:hypothetical protein